MIDFHPMLSPWLTLPLAAVAAIVIWKRRHHQEMPRHINSIIATLRVTAIAIIAAALLNPGFNISRKTPRKNKLVFLIDGSGSMKTADSPPAASRFDAALEFRKSFAKRNFPGLDKHFLLFSSSCAPVSDWQTLENFGADGGTDLARAMESIDRDPGYSKTAAIVLLSDGIDHSNFTPAPNTPPIFAVKFGSDLSSVKDIGIGDFPRPAQLRTGEEFTINIPLNVSGYPLPSSITSSFIVDNIKVDEQKTPIPAEGKARIEFTRQFQTPGLHTIAIQTEKFPGEATYLNNHIEFNVEVLSGVNHVLCYFPILTNSFRPLLRHLRSSGRDFSAVCRMAGDKYSLLGNNPDPAFKHGIPNDHKKLRQTDAIILGANRDSLLSMRELSVLEQYTASGGNLILLGGSDSFGELPANSPMSALSPVRTNNASFPTDTYKVTAPDNGGVFSQRIQQLQDNSITGINHIAGVKDGATIHLYAENHQRHPLVVSQPYGQGQVIAVLTNSIHLWNEQGVFWEQLISLAGGNRDKVLNASLERHELLPGEIPVAYATPRQGLDELPGFRLDISVSESNSDRVSFSGDMNRDNSRFTARLPALPDGAYTVKISCRTSEKVLGERFLPLLVGRRIDENHKLKVDNDNFLKYCHPDRVYDPGDASRLHADIIAAISDDDSQRLYFPFFESPFPYVAILLALFSGWFIRRRFNLL